MPASPSEKATLIRPCSVSEHNANPSGSDTTMSDPGIIGVVEIKLIFSSVFTPVLREPRVALAEVRTAGSKGGIFKEQLLSKLKLDESKEIAKVYDCSGKPEFSMLEQII